MSKANEILIALQRLNSIDRLITCQLFEVAYPKKSGLIRVPPHMIERLGEECLLSWKSTEARSYLDEDAVAFIRRIPWMKGEAPNLGPALLPETKQRRRQTKKK